ncbi:MAG: bifunctional adenosylcobinamide kinase/adenosylcobinamide-phosphate guanylyltransferase [Candidatus Nanopelagicales bacterium]
MIHDRVFLTGGARSGKSAMAERLLADAAAVTYVATGPRPETADPEWEQRIAAHRTRRPDHWTTLETTDLPPVIHAASPQHPVLVDCLTLWVTAHLDRLDAWTTDDPTSAQQGLDAEIDAVVAAVRACSGGLVVVSNEVGSGIVPADAGTRRFRDWLGIANARVAAVCDRSYLVAAGRAVRLEAVGTI